MKVNPVYSFFREITRVIRYRNITVSVPKS